MATGTPTAPATSSTAPSRSRLRRAAWTTICPPVASVMESAAKSTVPPLRISTRDRSRRSLPAAAMGASVCAPRGTRRPSRWLSSARSPPRSSRIAVALPAASVIRPSAPAAAKCRVPRAFTEVLDNSTPRCATSALVNVTSPRAAWIRPVFSTRPVAPAGVTSLPRVVDN